MCSIIVVGVSFGIIAFEPSKPEVIPTTVDLTDKALVSLFDCMEETSGDSRLCENEAYKAFKLLKQLDYEDTQKLLAKHPKKK